MKITYSNFFELIIYFFTKFYKIIKPASAGKTASSLNNQNLFLFRIYVFSLYKSNFYFPFGYLTNNPKIICSDFSQPPC